MSLDSAEGHRSAPRHDPTATVQVIGRRWAIAAGHPLAAGAGAQMLAAGGNAIDAGVAAGFTLGVVHPDMVSVAGVAPILVHVGQTSETWQVSGVGPYPRKSTVGYFRERHGGQIAVGVARTVVPAAPDAWCTALARWGTMSFADALAPALDYASRGFPVSTFSAYQFAANEARFRQWPTSAHLLPGGRAPGVGTIIVQKELGETLQRMIDAEKHAGGNRAAGIRAARDEFYRGETARRIAEYHRAEGGPLALEDLADFSVEVEPAMRGRFGALEVAVCGFWCQGPVLLQMLNLVDGLDLVRLGHNSPAYLHRLIETVKLAFADRHAFYGDPKFVKIPAERLLSEAYAEARRRLVGERAWPDMYPAGETEPAAPRIAPAVAGGSDDMLDTSYVAVIDADGNGFSATPSDPHVDSPVIPGVGCVVSPRGSQGWLDATHPGVVAPGKRPRLTPAPAMVLDGGRVSLCFGTPGGDVQQQAMLQVFLNHVVFGLPLQAAVEAPRFASRSFPDSFWPHTHAPGKVELESRIDGQTCDALAAMGHRVSAWPAWEWRAGAVCGVKAGADGTRWAAADPRRGALAIGR
ncbi:MAG: gamma-glutamyltransferase [Candidatus Rokubacteria bacterium]|nr:gamma-glutamyltransferase [Candidatus Rokubacteria bacterium]